MGKGDSYRRVDQAKWSTNYDLIFNKETPHAPEIQQERYCPCGYAILNGFCTRCWKREILHTYLTKDGNGGLAHPSPQGENIHDQTL
jgi:hypothetical protein